MCALVLCSSGVYASGAHEFEWQTVEGLPETESRGVGTTLGSDDTYLYFTRAAEATSRFYRISVATYSVAAWQEMTQLPLLISPQYTGDGIAYHDGYLYMFADTAGDAFREIIRYSIAGNAWEVSNESISHGSDTACIVDHSGNVYGGWRGWNQITKVTNWETLATAWQVAAQGGARHPWSSTRGPDYLYFLTYRSSSEPGDVYRLTATGAGATQAEAQTAWRQVPWRVGMGCAIEFVPSSISSTGNDELWVLRGTDTSAADGQGGGPTHNFAIYDIGAGSWLQFTLPYAYGIGSDMKRVDNYMYFLQGGSAEGEGVLVYTEIGLTTTNRAPSLKAVGNQRVIAGYTLELPVNAQDPDGDLLTLTCDTSALPGAVFTDHGDNSGTFTWTPTPAQAGVYPNIEFTASDAEFTVTETITLTVTNLADAVDVFINDIYVSGANNYTVDTSFGNPSIPSTYSPSRIDVAVIEGYYDFGTGFTEQGRDWSFFYIDPADVRDEGEPAAQFRAHGQYARSGLTNGVPGDFVGDVYRLDPDVYWVINELYHNSAGVTSGTFSAYVDALNMRKRPMSWPLSLGTNHFTLIVPGGAGEMLNQGMVSLLLSGSRTASYTNNTPPTIVTMEEEPDGGDVQDLGLGSPYEWDVNGHYNGDLGFFVRTQDFIVDSPSYATPFSETSEFFPYYIEIVYWNMAGDNPSSVNPFGLTGFSAPGWVEDGVPWIDMEGHSGIDNAFDDTICYLGVYVGIIPEPSMLFGVIAAALFFVRRMYAA